MYISSDHSIDISLQITLSQPYPVEPRDFIGYMVTKDQVSSGLSILPNKAKRFIYDLWQNAVPIVGHTYELGYIQIHGEPALGATIITNEGEIFYLHAHQSCYYNSFVLCFHLTILLSVYLYSFDYGTILNINGSLVVVNDFSI